MIYSLIRWERVRRGAEIVECYIPNEVFDRAKNVFKNEVALLRRICQYEQKLKKQIDVEPVVSTHIKTGTLLSKIDVDKHIEIEIKMDELDLECC